MKMIKSLKNKTRGEPIYVFKFSDNLVPRGRDAFGQKTGIATSGQVQRRKSAIYGLPVTLRMPRVKPDKSDLFWSQSIVFIKPLKTRMSLDLARGPDFQRMTKGTPGDEVGLETDTKLYLESTEELPKESVIKEH